MGEWRLERLHMHLNDFHFDLPNDLVARYPCHERSASRLMCVSGQDETILHRTFNQIIDLIQAGDLLVFNDTKVIKARLFGTKATGGKVEVLVERIVSHDRVLAQIHASKTPRLGQPLLFANGIQLTVVSRAQPFYELCYEGGDEHILDVIERIGQMPLPPYFKRLPDEDDLHRYQTVYAKHPGSVAAPTAGLHFDDRLLSRLKEKNVTMGYLTLHIGAGTFTPVRAESITQHKMHAEYAVVTDALCEQIKQTKSRGGRVIAVGTTSMRALETASEHGSTLPYQGDTDIFIYPGYQFRVVDALITNLHLPCSTLLMLVCAFAGHNLVMRAYLEAVANAYRFFSYGDAMWLTKAD